MKCKMCIWFTIFSWPRWPIYLKLLQVCHIMYLVLTLPGNCFVSKNQFCNVPLIRTSRFFCKDFFFFPKMVIRSYANLYWVRKQYFLIDLFESAKDNQNIRKWMNSINLYHFSFGNPLTRNTRVQWNMNVCVLYIECFFLLKIYLFLSRKERNIKQK